MGHHSPQAFKVNPLTLLFMVLAIMLLATQSVPTNATANVQSASSNNDSSYETCSFGLEYLGAFRVPSGTFGASDFNFGGSAIAFDPTRHWLWVVGHPHQQCVGAVIPPAPVISSNVGDLPIATMAQEFTPVLPSLQQPHPDPVNTIGGMMVIGNDLILSGYNFYATHNEPPQPASHFKLHIPSGQVSGLYQVGQQGGALVGGCMCPIPPEWQSDLGATHIAGGGPLNIVSRSSHGVSAFGFNPNLLSMGTVTPTIPYIFYPPDHLPPGSGYGGGLRFNGCMNVRGKFFPQGVRKKGVGKTLGAGKVIRNPWIAWVLDLGIGGGIGYGDQSWYGDFDDQDPPDTARQDRGPHIPPYSYAMIFSDVREFIKVKRGEKAPWEVETQVYLIDLPFQELVPSRLIGGVAYDSNTRRLYIAQKLADQLDEYYFKPIVHVWDVKPLMKNTARSYIASPQSSKEITRPCKQSAKPHKEVISPTQGVSKPGKEIVRPNKEVVSPSKGVLAPDKGTYPTILPTRKIAFPDEGGSAPNKIMFPICEEAHSVKSTNKGVTNYCWTKSPTKK